MLNVTGVNILLSILRALQKSLKHYNVIYVEITVTSMVLLQDRL